jgi:hypothetical protein
MAGWLDELKRSGGFGVDTAILELAWRDFTSKRVSDAVTVETIQRIYTATKKEKRRQEEKKKKGEEEERDKGESYLPSTVRGIAIRYRARFRNRTATTWGRHRRRYVQAGALADQTQVQPWLLHGIREGCSTVLASL